LAGVSFSKEFAIFPMARPLLRNPHYDFPVILPTIF
jgi:hypothetical protein